MKRRILLQGLGSALASPVAFATSAATSAGSDTGVTDTTIKIGQSAVFSGPSAGLGTEMKQGIDAGFKEANAAGGINGRRLELVSMDDGYEPDRAASNTAKLIHDDQVFALLGFVGTPTSNAALPIFTAQKVPFLAPLTGAASLREPFNKYIFNLRASYEDETRTIVDYLVKTMGNQRIAVLYQNDAYGASGLAGVERNSMIIGKAAMAIASSKPQSVILISAYQSSASFIKVMKALHSDSQFWNVSFVGSQALAMELGAQGPGTGISQVVPYPWQTAMPAALDLKQRVGEKDITFNTFEGFLAAKMFVEGLKRAGKSPTRESLIQALETAGKLDLGGFTVQFSPTNHNGSKFVELTMIGTGGKFVH